MAGQSGFRLVAEKEIALFFSGYGFPAVFLLSLALFSASLFIRTAGYWEQRGEQEEIDRIHLARCHQAATWEEFSFGQKEIGRPISALSLVCGGIDPAVGRVFRLHPKGEPVMLASFLDQSPAYAALGEFDLAFIFRVILSLVSIFLTYGTIAGERERGTLALTLSHSVPRDRLLTGKISGHFASVVLATLPALLLALLLAGLVRPYPFSPMDWAGLAAGVAVSYLYLFFFTGLGVMFTTLFRGAGTVLVALLLAWVGLVFVIPAAGLALSRPLAGSPSRAESDSRERLLWQDGYEAAFKKSDGIREKFWADPAREFTPERYPQATAEELAAMYDKARQECSALVKRCQAEVLSPYEKKVARLKASYARQQEYQLQLARGLARVSPAGAFSFALQELSGTGVRSFSLLYEQLSQHRDD